MLLHVHEVAFVPGAIKELPFGRNDLALRAHSAEQEALKKIAVAARHAVERWALPVGDTERRPTVLGVVADVVLRGVREEPRGDHERNVRTLRLRPGEQPL